MKTYSIELEARAARQLLKVDLATRRRIIKRLRLLADWPALGVDVKPLRGPLKGLYRLRVGRYRVILAVDDTRQIISVREIGHRGSVYR